MTGSETRGIGESKTLGTMAAFLTGRSLGRTYNARTLNGGLHLFRPDPHHVSISLDQVSERADAGFVQRGDQGHGGAQVLIPQLPFVHKKHERQMFLNRICCLQESSSAVLSGPAGYGTQRWTACPCFRLSWGEGESILVKIILMLNDANVPS